ncbi:MAG: hypothetical protein GXY32_06045 [Ruminococcaceae bacterium]|nr:hypothetical protein [Oscillospiraceae bacterium]
MQKKRPAALALALLLACCLAGCAAEPAGADEQFPQFEFTHYTSGGSTETYPAVILFEESNSTFTCYQVAFLSCTCRDSLVNYYSVCYVELLNNKPSADLATIRAISFGDNMGLYGDSNPNYYKHEFTEEYMDEHFVQALVGVAQSDFDTWQGYGSQLQQVDADAVAGASVTTGNVTSMLKSLFKYHAAKYYA